MQDEAINARLTELESRLEFQDETIAQLNDALVSQQQRVLELHKTLSLLIRSMRENDFEPGTPEDEPPPPHY